METPSGAHPVCAFCVWLGWCYLFLQDANRYVFTSLLKAARKHFDTLTHNHCDGGNPGITNEGNYDKKPLNGFILHCHSHTSPLSFTLAPYNDLCHA